MFLSAVMAARAPFSFFRDHFFFFPRMSLPVIQKMK